MSAVLRRTGSGGNILVTTRKAALRLNDFVRSLIVQFVVIDIEQPRSGRHDRSLGRWSCGRRQQDRSSGVPDGIAATVLVAAADAGAVEIPAGLRTVRSTDE